MYDMPSDAPADNQKPVIYFSGGTMQGIFGAGVVTSLQQHNVYEHLGAVYGASAGSLVGAYFLAGQSELGSRMMLEALTNTTFISPKNFILGIGDRLRHRYIKASDRSQWRNAINIPYLFSCIEEKYGLDTDTLTSRGIPLFIKVFNLDNRTIEYHDARGKHIHAWLRASVDVHPYTTEVQTIEGVRYADGAIKSVIGIDALLERHPETPIIIVLNTHRKRRVSQWLKNVFEAYFMGITGDADIAPLFRSSEPVLRDEIARIDSMNNVYLYAIPDDIPIRSRTTDPALLERTLYAGANTGESIADLVSTLTTTKTKQ